MSLGVVMVPLGHGVNFAIVTRTLEYEHSFFETSFGDMTSRHVVSEQSDTNHERGEEYAKQYRPFIHEMFLVLS